jgi:hypothetical protein
MRKRFPVLLGFFIFTFFAHAQQTMKAGQNGNKIPAFRTGIDMVDAWRIFETTDHFFWPDPVFSQENNLKNLDRHICQLVH